MNENGIVTIGKALRSLLRTRGAELPDLMALPYLEEFLRKRLTETPLPERKLDELALLVRNDETIPIKAFLIAELPSFLEDCVDFYFSRAAVRAALGFEPLPTGSEELAPWVGP
jgi:hypothetical protein